MCGNIHILNRTVHAETFIPFHLATLYVFSTLEEANVQNMLIKYIFKYILLSDNTLLISGIRVANKPHLINNNKSNDPNPKK